MSTKVHLERGIVMQIPDWQDLMAPWRAAAICTAYDPDPWFPKQGNSRAARWARSRCMECPVQMDCLRYGTFEHPQGGGVWGVTTERERRDLRAGRLTLAEWFDGMTEVMPGGDWWLPADALRNPRGDDDAAG